MMYIASTRFTNKTLEENNKYRESRNISGRIYGSGIKINEKYPLNCWMFVVEMNNSINQIEGIGVIRNMVVGDKYYRIYSNNNYNRYIYKGKYWLSRAQISDLNPELVEIFEKILFKGKSNLKRISGISVVTEKLFNRWEYNHNIILRQVKQMFIESFRSDQEQDQHQEIISDLIQNI